MLPPTFLGLNDVDLGEADVAVLLAPFDGTASYGKGTAKGPSAIITGTHHIETFDEELGYQFDGALKIATLEPFHVEKGEASEDYLRRVTRSCQRLTLAPPFPLSLGGEHSITPAVMGGIYRDPSSITVVQIDAHADLREDYLGSPYNHACAMRQVLDLGIQRLIALGIRSAEESEHEFARDDERVQTFYAYQLQRPAVWAQMIDVLRNLEGDVYLTIDIDGLDLPWCPGTGTPMPGGLSWYQTMDILRAVIRESRANLVGADVMETAPQPQTQVNEMVAAKLATKILAYRFAPR